MRQVERFPVVDRPPRAGQPSQAQEYATVFTLAAMRRRLSVSG
jgi:hypothetical protein